MKDKKGINNKAWQRRSFKVKYQSNSEKDSAWFKCNTDPRKRSSKFALQEQMIETRAWKKIKGLMKCDKRRLCSRHRKTVCHLLSGYKKLLGTEYVKQLNNILKVLTVNWGVKNGLLPEDTKQQATNWERGK